MADKSIGFVGGGRVTSILLSGWRRAEAMPGKATVFDCSDQALASLKVKAPEIATTGDMAEAASQDVVFLAVHPPVIKDVLPQLKPHLQTGAVLVSLAPKFTIAKLSEMLGSFGRIVRMIPNAPSVVGKGLNPVAFAPVIEAGDRSAIFQMLQPLGDCPEVPEEQLEAYAIIAAMGPTYFWPQLYELKSLAKSFGLSEEAAMEAMDKMLWGTVATMKDSGLSGEQVQDLIPVKPMAEETAALVVAYRQKLTGLMEKIRP
jgi:pyrroline-5-carboxylate reductase